MFKTIEELPAGIVGVEAVGNITRQDYDDVIVPLFERYAREGKKIRFLYWFGPNFESLSPGAAWNDFKVGVKHIRLFERCAVVTDSAIIKYGSVFAGAFMPCPVKVFSNNEMAQARTWLMEQRSKL